MTETTIVSQESVAQEQVSKLALRWIFPVSERSPIFLEHGLRIGRGEDCQIRINGEGVSRSHAEVLCEGPVLSLRDLGSTNGTHLGGERVPHSVLEAGAVLRVGGWVGVLERLTEEEASVATEDLGAGLFGGNAMRQALYGARQSAPTDLPIVLQGETGTGKEVVARAIHHWSGRGGPFCAVNAAALPAQLAEAELFGYRKGAFTGAERNSVGHFRAANGGTLLLDEISDLDLGTQAKLLRVLQEQQVQPLGESQPVNIDVRVIVACQKPLLAAVEAGAFRRDLFMRLKGVEVELPPLRQRRGDIPRLFSLFVRQHATGAAPSADARLVETLCLHAWPGNVRELELTARQLLAVYPHEAVLKRRFLPDGFDGPTTAAPLERPTSSRKEHDLIRLAELLRKHQGNMSRACAELQISRQRGYRLLDGMSVQDFMQQHESAP